MGHSRREIIIAAMAAGAAPSAFAQSADLRDAAREMWLYALPLIEMATTRTRRAMAPNSLVHARQLSGPAAVAVTTPNNDTLYSNSWLDLRGGPLTLTLPATGRRYFSMAFMDMYTNNFAILGTPTTGGRGGTWTIVGPSSKLSGPRVIKAPTPSVWMLGRTLVESEADLPNVHKLQDAMKLTGGNVGTPFLGAPARTAMWPAYFAAAQALINENPPPPMDSPFFVRAAALGVRPGGAFNPAVFRVPEAAQIEAGVNEAMRQVREGRLVSTDGVGVATTDYLLRARIALSGLAALPKEEAVYLQINGPAGEAALEGPYRLTFKKAELPPVNAFWSISMYRVTPEAQRFFAANPINRYAIGDRTPGLVYNPDGSLDIWVSRTDPGPARRANWLPAPATGPYALTLRGYLPKKPMLDGVYRPPAMVRL